jgi:hypothetical protein
MSSRYSLALALVLGSASLAAGQESTPAQKNFQGRVGKTITVQEASRPAERCVVLEAWELADGNAAMQVRSLQSNLLITVVEQTKSKDDDRFLVYRWSADGLPPNGCPVPPGMKSLTVQRDLPGGASQVAESAPMPSSQPRSSSPVLQSNAKKGPAASGIVQASAKSPPPAATGVVQASAKSPAPVASNPSFPPPPSAPPMAPPSGVMQAKAPGSVPTVTRVVEQRPITTEMPRIVGQGQPAPAKPTAPPAVSSQPPTVVSTEGTVGRLINVTEKGKPTEKCVVLESCCQPDGGCWMKVKSLATGEVMTIVCGPERGHFGKSFFDLFRRARCNNCEVCCEPCPPPAPPAEKLPVMPKPKAEQPKSRTDLPKPTTVVGMIKSMTTKPAGDPLLPPANRPEEPVAKKPDKLPDMKPKEAPKVVEKPKEEPKLPPPAPKEVVTQPTPPAPTKIVDAKPLPEKGVMVPVPLVPLSTDDARPRVPPPQPVLRPFDTHESKSVARAEAQPKAPIPVPGAKPAAPVVQAMNKVDAAPGYQPRMPNCDPCVGPVAPTGWTGPFKPVTQVPAAIEGVKRASYQQDALTTENTVYLMTVLQSSGTPAQREWAASRLCTCDARVAPYVIETLATVAKSDPAALVRVACIQSLVKLQAKDAMVTGMLQQAKFDRDPRVQDEAETALAVLLGVKPEVKQASQKAKR